MTVESGATGLLQERLLCIPKE